MPKASRSRSRSASPSTIWLKAEESSPNSSEVVTGTCSSKRPWRIRSVAASRSSIGRRIERESSTVSSKLIVKETKRAISTLMPSASVPPPFEVSAATTMPVITLISGSEPSSLTRSGTTGRSIRTGTSRLELMSKRIGRRASSRAR